jgi:hypothetical protein
VREQVTGPIVDAFFATVETLTRSDGEWGVADFYLIAFLSG